MHDLSNAVLKNPILERILPALPERTYLVGGCVRDFILGEEPSDFDLVPFGPSMELAGKLGNILSGKAFFIDRERQVARVALERGALTIDISPPKGADIEEDLAERDITINAMACDPRDGTLIDPLGGLQDLRNKRIRLIAEKNLMDDPLRGLRCLRFAHQLGFSLDGETCRIVGKNAGSIESVAAERIKYEFLKALKCPGRARFFSLLADAGYIPAIFGEAPNELNIRAALDLAGQMDALGSEAPAFLAGMDEGFADELEHGLCRSGALSLAAFFYGLSGTAMQAGSADLVQGWCARLSLSLQASRAVARSISGAWAVKGLLEKPESRCSDRFRLLSDYQGCIPEMLLLALAGDALAPHKGAGGPRRETIQADVASLWGYFLGTCRAYAANPLLTGHDVMGNLSVDPGPKVGELLRRVEEARADGIVSNREQALEYLRAAMKE